MAIRFEKYVDIVSGVLGGAQVALRELIGRVFTTNPLVPTNSQLEFTDADQVLEFFGQTSEEYTRAQFYFRFISKLLFKPNKISFAHWAEVASVPLIFGDKSTKVLATFQAINNGQFILVIGGTSYEVINCDFTGAASLADCATVLQTRIQAQGADSQFTAATVVYDATRGAFNLTAGGPAGDATINTGPGTGGTDIIGLIGWVNPGSLITTTSAIFSDGSDAQTVTEVLTESAEASNNFGSFCFNTDTNPLTLAQATEAAQFAAAQDIKFMYMLAVAEADIGAWQAALANFGGVGIEVVDPNGSYAEMLPMAILASTRYDKENSVQNYMYQQHPDLTPSVDETSVSDVYDAINVNYYGVTQQAGQLVSFFQRGKLQGTAQDPAAMNVFANEIWLKDAAGVAILNKQLNLPRISANKRGRALIINTLQNGPVEQALLNGTISPGKELTDDQKEVINTLTNDELAWQQVETVGYWIDAEIVNTGPGEFAADYLLVYSKDDVINKVNGRHALI